MNKGFTLLEALISISITSIIVILIFNLIPKISKKNYSLYNDLYQIKEEYTFYKEIMTYQDKTIYSINNTDFLLVEYNDSNIEVYFDDYILINNNKFNIKIKNYEIVDNILILKYTKNNLNYIIKIGVAT